MALEAGVCKLVQPFGHAPDTSRLKGRHLDFELLAMSGVSLSSYSMLYCAMNYFDNVNITYYNSLDNSRHYVYSVYNAS